MSTAERFESLFRGYDKRHGQYTIKAQEDSGKMSGRADTVHERPLLANYERHLKGEQGIGIIPLTQDNQVYFAALDIDDYTGNVSHNDLARRLEELPVIVSRSKSDGVHVWLFIHGGAPAKDVVSVMKIWAGQLGFGGCEIFPKQVKRASREDVGNWINLPYFGESRNAVLIDQNGDPFEATLEQFLEHAEKTSMTVTREFLANVAPNVKSQRSTKTDGPDLKDGPPCLERLFLGDDKTNNEPQLAEGGRNTAFFNLGQYFMRKYQSPAVVQAKLIGTNLALNPPLPEGEIVRLAKQAEKEYGYQCQQEPLKQFCNRRACLKRSFGIGSGETDWPIEISGMTKIMTDPPMYAFNADGARIRMKDGKELLHQKTFQVKVMDATSKIIPALTDVKFGKLIENLLRKGDTIDAPPDTSSDTEVLEEFSIFLERRKARELKQVLDGKVWWDDERDYAWFRFNSFTSYLKSQRIQFDRRELALVLKKHGAQYKEKGTTIAGVSVRPWLAPLDVFVPIQKDNS